MDGKTTLDAAALEAAEEYLRAEIETARRAIDKIEDFIDEQGLRAIYERYSETGEIDAQEYAAAVKEAGERAIAEAEAASLIEPGSERTPAPEEAEEAQEPEAAEPSAESPAAEPRRGSADKGTMKRP